MGWKWIGLNQGISFKHPNAKSPPRNVVEDCNFPLRTATGRRQFERARWNYCNERVCQMLFSLLHFRSMDNFMRILVFFFSDRYNFFLRNLFPDRMIFFVLFFSDRICFFLQAADIFSRAVRTGHLRLDDKAVRQHLRANCDKAIFFQFFVHLHRSHPSHWQSPQGPPMTASPRDQWAKGYFSILSTHEAAVGIFACLNYNDKILPNLSTIFPGFLII